MADDKKDDVSADSTKPEDQVQEDTGSGSVEELDDKTLYIKVYSPYQVYYDGIAQSISAENDTGPFDILPKHHNFMTLVNEGEVIIRAEGQEDKKIRITHGVMHVRRNKVTLFLDV